MNENISDMQTKITVAEEEGEHLSTYFLLCIFFLPHYCYFNLNFICLEKKLIKFEEIETFLEEQVYTLRVIFYQHINNIYFSNSFCTSPVKTVT